MLIKVEQINDNLFLNTCKRKNKQKIAYTNEVKIELIRNEDEMKRPSRVNTRDIRPREAQVSTDYGRKEMRKR